MNITIRTANNTSEALLFSVDHEGVRYEGSTSEYVNGQFQVSGSFFFIDVDQHGVEFENYAPAQELFGVISENTEEALRHHIETALTDVADSKPSFEFDLD